MAYHPHDTTSNWINLLEEELSAAQTSDLKKILMSDINIDLHACSNSKWLHFIQLLNLTQLVTDFTGIISLTANFIDHIYSSNPEKVLNVLSHHMQ